MSEINDTGEVLPILTGVQVPTIDPDRYSSERFNGIHNAIISLAAGGSDEVQISKQVGLTPETVLSILSSHMAKERIKAMTAPLVDAAQEVELQMQAATVLALDTQLTIMTDTSQPAAVRAGIAKDLHDRKGPIRKEAHIEAVIPPERLMELRKSFLNPGE